MGRDFKKFPELRNSEIDFYYWESPHKQIFEDFSGKCIKVIDGDTIRVTVNFRNFDFPIRMLDIDAAELGKPNSNTAKSHLERVILNKQIDVRMDIKNRVDKFGRLLGKIFSGGQDVGEEMLSLGLVSTFDRRREGEVSFEFQEIK